MRRKAKRQLAIPSGPRARTSTGLGLLLVLALVSCAANGEPGPTGGGAWRAILEAENARSRADRARLDELLRHEDPEIRAGTARALGRIRAPWCALPLGTALGDTSPQVRAAAAYGLGQFAIEESKAQATTALLGRIGDPDTRVRAAVHEALGRVGSFEIVPTLMRGLADPRAEVQESAAIALSHQQVEATRKDSPWPEAQQARFHEALREAWQARVGEPGAWRFVYALMRLRHPDAAGDLDRVFEPGSSVTSRIFAIRGLAELVRSREVTLPDEQLQGIRERLLWLLRDEEPRIRIEAALALSDPSRAGRNAAPPTTPAPFASPKVLEALAQTLQDENPLVARVAALGLGHFHPLQAQAREVLQVAETSKVLAVRSAAILAQARLLGRFYASTLALHAESKEPYRGLAAAAGLRFLSTREAVPIARTLAAHPSARCRIAALSALAEHREDRKTIDIALSALSDPSLAVREAAVDALAEIGDESCLPALLALLPEPGRESPDAALAELDRRGSEDLIELRQGLLTALARIAPEGKETRARLLAALREDPSFSVREVAHDLLRERAGSEAVPALRRPESERPLPLPSGSELVEFLRSSPELEMRTSQGTLRFRLWPDVAPVHCWNLLALAKDGGYDDRIWHRVVPNFVVQGGDSTGTGSGSRSSFGFRLRDELGPKSFLAYVLGMPRSQKHDTGGEQIFVTLVPTPHLDGRYTAFGELVEGFDVLERITVEDRIESVRRPR